MGTVELVSKMKNIVEDSSFKMRHIPFKDSCQYNHKFNEKTPKDFVNLFIDDIFLDLLICGTNESLKTFEDAECSNSKYCSPLDRSEMKIFLAFILYSGIVKLHRIDDFWRKDSLFKIQYLTEKMTRLRFVSILKNLCITNNGTKSGMLTEVADNLSQVEPLVSCFNQKMKLFSPNKRIFITEPIVLLKNGFKYRNELPNTNNYKDCIKLFFLADCTKCVMKIFIANGINDAEDTEILKISIAMKLLEDHLNRGHSLYMDEYYSSLALTTILLEKSTYSTGIILPSQRMFPKEFKAFKICEGQLAAKMCNGICISKMKVGEDKYFISSEYNDEKENVETRKGIKKLPKVLVRIQNGINDYSALQRDTAEFYPFEKHLFKWHRKVAFHILHIIMLNSYYLFKHFSGKNKMSMYDFRLHVIKSLISNGPQIKYSIVNSHVPRKRQSKDQCKLCSMKTLVNFTSFCCLDCQEKPYLCLKPCFKEYHEKQ